MIIWPIASLGRLASRFRSPTRTCSDLNTFTLTLYKGACQMLLSLGTYEGIIFLYDSVIYPKLIHMHGKVNNNNYIFKII